MKTDATKPSKNDLAYGAIKKMIVTNQLKPGLLVNESLLAETLGMSRTPIREAIGTLCREGFLSSSDGGGVCVKSPTVKDIYDLGEVSLALETLALKSAVHHIPPEKIDALRIAWQEARQVLAAEGGGEAMTERLLELDSQTYDLIIDHADNRIVPQIYENVRLKLQWFRRMIVSTIENDINSIDAHLDILNQIQAGDVQGAEQTIKNYNNTSLQLLLDYGKFTVYEMPIWR